MKFFFHFNQPLLLAQPERFLFPSSFMNILFKHAAEQNVAALLQELSPIVKFLETANHLDLLEAGIYYIMSTTKKEISLLTSCYKSDELIDFEAPEECNKQPVKTLHNIMLEMRDF